MSLSHLQPHPRAQRLSPVSAESRELPEIGMSHYSKTSFEYQGLP